MDAAFERLVDLLRAGRIGRRLFLGQAAIAAGSAAVAGELARAHAALATAEPSRRTFPLGALASGPLAQGAAELVLLNGRIYTMGDGPPVAEAVAIKDGRFIVVGSNAEARAAAGPGTRELDLGGRTVIPGLIDSHNHMLSAGAALFRLDLAPARSVGDVLRAVATAAADTPAGEWIAAGSGWRVTSLAEGRYPTRQELDSVAPDHPVWLPSGGHVGVANGLALQLAGVTRDTPEPDGGHIEHDASGDPTGLLLEQPATSFVARLIPPPSHERRAQGLRRIMATYTAAGITGVRDPGITPDDMRIYQELWANGELSLRVAMMLRQDRSRPLHLVDDLAQWGVVSGMGDDWLRVDGVKLGVDGGASLATALVERPYKDQPDNRGTQVVSTDTLATVAVAAHRLGWRIGTHAVGGRAVDLILDAYAQADADHPIRGRRFAIEHAYVEMTPERMARIKALDLVVNAQPAFLYHFYPALVGNFEEERLVAIKPLRDYLTAGVTLAGGSDSTTGPYPPLLGIWSAVNRLSPRGNVIGPDQRLTAEEALRMYTRGSAYALNVEQARGAIEPGKLADLVVLGADLLRIAPEGIRDIPVALTIIGGRVVHDGTAAQRPAPSSLVATTSPSPAGVVECCEGDHALRHDA
jgi:predicted amidohydrolase YtcJ